MFPSSSAKAHNLPTPPGCLTQTRQIGSELAKACYLIFSSQKIKGVGKRRHEIGKQLPRAIACALKERSLFPGLLQPGDISHFSKIFIKAQNFLAQDNRKSAWFCGVFMLERKT